MKRWLLLTLLLAAPAHAQPFPRLGISTTIDWYGRPYLTSDGTPIDSVFAPLAKFDLVSIEAEPCIRWPQILAKLREQNPQVKVVGFVNGHFCWWNPDHAAGGDTLSSITRQLWRAAQATGGFLYGKYGDFFNPWHPPYVTNYWSWYNLDWANRALAESTAAIYARTVAAPRFDGIFIDWYDGSIRWTSGGLDTIDYSRSGFRSLAAWDSSWRFNHAFISQRLREAGGCRYLILGNPAVGLERGPLNGGVRENFPRQAGGSWQTNMLGYASDPGMLADETACAQPAWSSLAIPCSPCSDPRSAYNVWAARWGLANACLAGGWFELTANNRALAMDLTDWYDEYAVDLSTRTCVNKERCTGWLGWPLGPATQYQGLWRRDFQFGIVLVNPAFSTVTIKLESMFYRLRGSSPVNYGGYGMTFSLPAQDAIFLARFSSLKMPQ